MTERDDDSPRTDPTAAHAAGGGGVAPMVDASPGRLPPSSSGGAASDRSDDRLEAPREDGLAEVLSRAAGGDQDAWREIVARFGPRVFAAARSHLGSHDQAEEITQSVFVTLAQKLPAGGYAEQGRFESWLMRIAMNRVRDEARRRKRQATPRDPGVIAESMDGARTEDAVFSDGDEHATLRRAIERLDEDDRVVIELRHLAEQPFKQIAETLGKPLGTVLARHHRALKKLRGLLEESA